MKRYIKTLFEALQRLNTVFNRISSLWMFLWDGLFMTQLFKHCNLHDKSLISMARLMNINTLESNSINSISKGNTVECLHADNLLLCVWGKKLLVYFTRTALSSKTYRDSHSLRMWDFIWLNLYANLDRCSSLSTVDIDKVRGGPTVTLSWFFTLLRELADGWTEVNINKDIYRHTQKAKVPR